MLNLLLLPLPPYFPSSHSYTLLGVRKLALASDEKKERGEKKRKEEKAREKNRKKKKKMRAS